MATAKYVDERQFNIEFEGRIISSLVGLSCVLLTFVDLKWAVVLILISVIIDLVRCSWRKHLLDPAIVFHHCIVIVITVLQLSLFQKDSIITQGTESLLWMEITNPFLHGAWILSKHPKQSSSKVRYHTLKLSLAILASLFLWPQFRIWSTLQFARTILLNDQNIFLVFWIASLAMLQLIWQFKFVKIVVSSARKLKGLHEA